MFLKNPLKLPFKSEYFLKIIVSNINQTRIRTSSGGSKLLTTILLRIAESKATTKVIYVNTFISRHILNQESRTVIGTH